MRPALATALLGVVLALTAATFDAEPLYVAGAGFVALPLGAVAWVLAASHGLRVERTVAVRRVLEDQPVRIDIRVRAAHLALPAGVIEDPLLPGPALVPSGRRSGHVQIDARFARRGRKRLEPPRVIVRDPFGLATRVVVGDEPAEVLVLPRVEKVVTPHGEGDGIGLAARRGRPSVAAEVDLDGLRPHRPGAPASRMYWPALARTGELMERRLRADTDTRPLVVLDPRGAPDEDALDAAVRAAASLCVHLAREGGCALLLPGDRRPTALEPTLASWEHAHARLAVVADGAAPLLAGMAARRGPVFYVAAAPGRSPRALSHAPGGGRVLVAPGALPGRRALFTVAGCTAYELSGQHRAVEVA